MISEEQKLKIKERILVTLKLFYENNGKIGDEDLARLVSIAGDRKSVV